MPHGRTPGTKSIASPPSSKRLTLTLDISQLLALKSGRTEFFRFGRPVLAKVRTCENTLG